jgi:hypothetical protein
VSGEGHRQQFERMGADRVRAALNTGKLPLAMIPDAEAWLAQLDEEERSRKEASQALQDETASRAAAAAERAADAAETANTRATIAIIIAVISIIISIIRPWILPR